MQPLADEPTHRVVWEVVEQMAAQPTVRIQFEEIVDEVSDGVPQPLEAERSATVAVTMVDIDEMLSEVIELARRDRLGIQTINLRVDEATPLGSTKAIALCVPNWKKFQEWFPWILGEVQDRVFRMYDIRKATAVMFRLRLLAQEVVRRRPPMDLNHLVLRLE